MQCPIEEPAGGAGAAEGNAAFLHRLGERVREARARRGMTRKQLARESGVSERYLAQLEAGQGNISITLLRQVARAMTLPLGELLREAPAPLEMTLLMETLARLAPEQLAEARRMLGAAFQESAARGRRRIALIGLRGAGKSTLGARLGAALGVPFIELDREIEQSFGTNLGEVFDLYGHAAYRRAERAALAAVIARHDRAVIATGGSIVAAPATYDLLLSACFTVWLKARPDEHLARVAAQGDFRPMAASAQAMADLEQILAGRNALYAKADAAVDTAGATVEESFARLYAVAAAVSASASEEQN